MSEEKYHIKLDKHNVKGVKKDTQRMDFVFSHKSMQFVLSCGIVMARIDTEIDNLASLYWHYKRAKNLDEFIDSVRKHVDVVGHKLTSNDITKLRQHYVNYVDKVTNHNQRVIDALTTDKTE